MRSFALPAKLTLALIAIPGLSLPCTIVEPHYQSGSSFRVRVDLQDVRVSISGTLDHRGGAEEKKWNVVTDKAGVAVLRVPRPGRYYVSSELPGVGGAYVDVKPGGPANVTIPLESFNRHPPLRVRSLRGEIRRPSYSPGQLQPTFSLELTRLGPRPAGPKAIQTNQRGEFDFGSSEAGSYLMLVKQIDPEVPGFPVTVAIPMTVDSKAPAEGLNLDVGASSCGGWYADRSLCHQPELQVSRLSGVVVDPSGAPVPNAAVFLLDSSGALIEQFKADDNGRFASPQSLAGTYQLVVLFPGGFVPARATLRSTNAGASSPPNWMSALTVRLGILGSCSLVTLQ